MTYTTPPTG